MAKLEVGPDSLHFRSGVISMPRAEGIPRIASVREATTNRMAIMGMPTSGSLVVLMSVLEVLLCLISDHSNYAVK
jgi:hypothetical protein